MINSPEWPTYSGDREEFRIYQKGSFPRPTAPQDTPLPFDRTNGNRNYVQLFGKEASKEIHEARKFLAALRVRVPHWPSETTIALGVSYDGDRPLRLLSDMLGGRPHPIWARIISNAPSLISRGNGFAGLVYASAHEGAWHPITELVAWSNREVIYHLLVPHRWLIEGGSVITSIHQVTPRFKFNELDL